MQTKHYCRHRNAKQQLHICLLVKHIKTQTVLCWLSDPGLHFVTMRMELTCSNEPATVRNCLPYLQSLSLSLEGFRGIGQGMGFLGCLRCHTRCSLTILGSRHLWRCHHLHGLGVNTVAVNHQSTRLNSLQCACADENCKLMHNLSATRFVNSA